MFFRALQTRDVFAVHCELEGDRLSIGWLFVNRAELWGQIVTLIETDNPETGGSYTIQLPPAKTQSLQVQILELESARTSDE